MSHNSEPHVIPMIDLSSFTANGGIESRKERAKEIAQKVSKLGCIGITGHGITTDQLTEAFAMSKALFDLSYEDKMKAPHPDATTPHRGYSGFGREQAAAKSAYGTDDEAQKEIYANTTDFKESYEIGSEANNLHYNIWLPEDVLPGFKTTTIELYWKLNSLALSILEALIMSLDVLEAEEDMIRALHTGDDNQLRLLHYPTIPAKSLNDKSFSRLGAHTDWGLFTLLFQDGNGGLEFQDRTQPDVFVPAAPIEGVVYLNIGDCFERISNGLYPSALHRVVIHTVEDSGAQNPRYSIPYFVGPRPDGLIQTPASLITRHGKRNYEPMTFEEYSNKMFEAINQY